MRLRRLGNASLRSEIMLGLALSTAGITDTGRRPISYALRAALRDGRSPAALVAGDGPLVDLAADGVAAS